MNCNLCIYEPMCWRLTIGMKPKNDCKDFKGWGEIFDTINNNLGNITVRLVGLPEDGRDNR